MSMPSFTAEKSLYVAKNHYRVADSRGFWSDVRVEVIPQDCSWLNEIECGIVVGGALVVCGASCAAGALSGGLGGIPCVYCLAAAGAGVGATCFECLPGWIQAVVNEVESIVNGVGTGDGGGGGGGGSGPKGPCNCPVGTKCCGTCRTITVGTKPVRVCTHCC